METLGTRLKALRKEKGLTLDMVASHFGTSSITISRYENGVRELKSESLNDFAEFYNVSVDYLLKRTSIRNYSSLNNDVSEVMSSLLDELKSGKELIFDGKPMSEDELNSFLGSLEVVMEVAKKKSKDKSNK